MAKSVPGPPMTPEFQRQAPVFDLIFQPDSSTSGRRLDGLLVRTGGMNDVDAVHLAERLDIPAVILQEDDLVKSQDIAAILDVIHLNFHARPASSGRGRVDVAEHRPRIQIERIGLEELNERHRLSHRPEDLR